MLGLPDVLKAVRNGISAPRDRQNVRVYGSGRFEDHLDVFDGAGGHCDMRPKVTMYLIKLNESDYIESVTRVSGEDAQRHLAPRASSQ